MRISRSQLAVRIAFALGGMLLVFTCVLLFFKATKPSSKAPADYKDPALCSAAIWNNFSCWLINLDSAPDRLEHFATQFNSSDAARRGFTRVPAVNGKQLPNVEELLTPKAYEELVAMERMGHRTRHAQLSRGAIGCSLSHVQTWKLALESGEEYAYVFEDDALLPKDILKRVSCTPLPADLDILLLGVVCYKCTGMSDKPLRKVNRFFGTHAYIISRKCMEKLLVMPDLVPLSQQIDSFLSDKNEQGEIKVYALKQDIVTQNMVFPTSIQVPLKATGKEWASEPVQDLPSGGQTDQHQSQGLGQGMGQGMGQGLQGQQSQGLLLGS